ncbi:MAG: S1/P1 nuclease, partial [Pseudomonadota bacterium]
MHPSLRRRCRALAAPGVPSSRRALPALALAAALVLAPGLAAAWSAPGHRIVGLAAEQLLSGDARRELRALVGDESLADLGLYLDAERDRLARELPGSTKWHFDNRPVCDAAAPRARYCPDGHCASVQFERWLRVLADRAAPRERRVLALRIVVHVLADVHQPLHAADNRDRGGNDVNVGWGRRDQVRSLHRLWDRELVDAAMGRESERGFAMRLVSERRREMARIQGGT